MEDSRLILVVDDSPIQRKIFVGTLKANGYSVIVGENGREAIELTLQHHPALILMDISMPEMDGLSATQELRANPDIDQVPILALTASTEPEDLEMARQAGYTDVVDKNGDRSLFLEQILHWLS